MGFETFNPILNLGGLFIVFLIYAGQLIYLVFLKIVVEILKGIRKRQKEFKLEELDDFEGGEHEDWKIRWTRRLLKYSGR